jgi:hypothetical protein
MAEGYNEKKIDHYRQTRMLMFTMVRVWADKGPKTPEELWPLPGDKEKITEDETKSLLERFAKLPKLNG